MIKCERMPEGVKKSVKFSLRFINFALSLKYHISLIAITKKKKKENNNKNKDKKVIKYLYVVNEVGVVRRTVIKCAGVCCMYRCMFVV